MYCITLVDWCELVDVNWPHSLSDAQVSADAQLGSNVLSASASFNQYMNFYSYPHHISLTLEPLNR